VRHGNIPEAIRPAPPSTPPAGSSKRGNSKRGVGEEVSDKLLNSYHMYSIANSDISLHP
jgi:hypothetical protein